LKADELSLAIQAKLLHGEQYLSIKGPIPTSGTLINTTRILEVLDKGKAAAVTAIVETKDKATGEVIFENQSTVFLRGSGGFGGKKTGSGMLLLCYGLSIGY
jgi:multifunctional beta-oxidation protein